MAWYMLWPGEAWHGVQYDLAMHGMVYDMASWARHDIWYVLAAMVWYILWPGGHHMVFGMAWRSMSWYVESYRITCIKALPCAIIPFTRGVADVNWRSCSHVPDAFIEGLLHACSVHTYSSCSVWEGIVNQL